MQQINLNRLNDLILKDKTRWFLFSPLLIGIGITIYFNLKHEPDLFHMAIPLLLGIGYIYFIRKGRLLATILFAAMMIVAIGFAAGQLRQHYVNAPVLEKKVKSALEATVGKIFIGEKNSRVIFEDISSTPKLKNSIRKIQLNIRTGADHLKPGMRVSLNAILLPPPGPTHPGAYDYQRDLYFKEIGAVGYALDRPVIITQQKNGLTYALRQIRHEVSRQIVIQSPKNTIGFLLAVMVGEKSYLKPIIQEKMRASGLAHLLAISGLHMVMIGGLVFFAIRLAMSCFPVLALNYPIKKIAAVIAIISLSFYLLMSGMSVSAVRAYLMITLVFIAVCFDRTAISLRNLAFAAIAILLFAPESLFTASFQMSFSAVFCLICLYEKIGGKFLTFQGQAPLIAKPFIYLAGITMTSLIASAATAPFAIYHFGQFAFAGIVTNLVAVPLMGFWVMPWVLVSFILLPFGLAGFSLTLAGEGVVLIQHLAAWGADFPLAQMKVSAIAPYALTAFSIAVIWFFIPRTKLKYGAIAALVFAVIFQLNHRLPDILISDSTNLILYNFENETPVVNTFTRDRFDRGRWQEMYGVKEFRRLASAQKDPETGISCDTLGCVWRRRHLKIVYSTHTLSHVQDCHRADILISQSPLPRDCPNPKVKLGWFDFWRMGAHAIYFDEKETVDVRSVNGVRGDRPWVPIRARKAD